MPPGAPHRPFKNVRRGPGADGLRGMCSSAMSAFLETHHAMKSVRRQRQLTLWGSPGMLCGPSHGPSAPRHLEVQLAAQGICTNEDAASQESTSHTPPCSRHLLRGWVCTWQPSSPRRPGRPNSQFGRPPRWEDREISIGTDVCQKDLNRSRDPDPSKTKLERSGRNTKAQPI